MGYLSDTIAAIACNRVAAKAAPLAAEPAANRKLTFAFKSFSDEKGIIVAKVSVAGIFDLENERVTEAALEAATYELVANIGAGKAAVDINHESEPIDCQILQAWYGDPMPEPTACYVALRPADREIYEAAKSGKITGMSWAGNYKLVDANLDA